MSSFSAVFIRNKEVDYVFMATDSAQVVKKEVFKDGMILPEKYYGLSSKSIYIPHIKTSVSVMGLTWLAHRIHHFIDSIRIIESMDQLTFAINTSFHKFYKDKAADLDVILDDNNNDFLGAIILTGVSYYFNGSITEPKRDRSLLMSRKFMIYKYGVKDCGWLNSESEDYLLTNMMEVHHPALPDKEIEKVHERNSKLMNQDFYSGAISILRDKLIISNKIYNEQDRGTMVAAGEVHATIMSLNKNDKYGEGLSVGHSILHRFDDFEDIKEEIRSVF